MSGYNYQSDLDELEDEARREASGKGLRSMLEEALKENKRLLEKINEKDKAESVAQLVKDAKLDPAVAALAAQQNDPAAWIEANKALFRPASEVESEIPVVVAEDTDAAVVASREAAAAKAMADAERDGSPAVTQEEVDKIASINSEEDLLALIAKAQAAQGDS